VPYLWRCYFPVSSRRIDSQAHTNILHNHVWRWVQCSSETLVSACRSTLHQNPDGQHRHPPCRENLRSLFCVGNLVCKDTVSFFIFPSIEENRRKAAVKWTDMLSVDRTLYREVLLMWALLLACLSIHSFVCRYIARDICNSVCSCTVATVWHRWFWKEG
jgi:hypothetical protein